MKLTATFSGVEPGLPDFVYVSELEPQHAAKVADPASKVGAAILPRFLAQAIFDACFEFALARRLRERALKMPDAPELSKGSREWAGHAAAAQADVERELRSIIGPDPAESLLPAEVKAVCSACGEDLGSAKTPAKRPPTPPTPPTAEALLDRFGAK